MVERRRESRDANEGDDGTESYRSVSITEASDGFVVDVAVDWDDSSEGPDEMDVDAAPGAGRPGESTAEDPVRTPGQEHDAAADPLPNRLVLDGNDTQGDATYTVAVSGKIRPDGEASSTAEVVEQPGSPTDGRVVGIVDGDTHVYRYSGVLEELSVDGHVDIRFGGGRP